MSLIHLLGPAHLPRIYLIGISCLGSVCACAARAWWAGAGHWGFHIRHTRGDGQDHGWVRLGGWLIDWAKVFVVPTSRKYALWLEFVFKCCLYSVKKRKDNRLIQFLDPERLFRIRNQTGQKVEEVTGFGSTAIFDLTLSYGIVAKF